MIRFTFFVLLMGLLNSGNVSAADRHDGYYYPTPKKIETYRARARVLQKNSKANRLEFINGITAGLIGRPYPPQYAIFAKGIDSEKMIIVSNVGGQLNTIYRVRAFLATMTAVARKSPLFRQFNVENILNFFDFAKMLGFRQITISDGEKFTHQVLLK